MARRLTLLLSLLANLGFVVLLILSRQNRSTAPVSPAGVFTNAQALQPAATVKTNLVIRRQFFSWSELESPDYATFVANLRRIACPESTIRDIIVADVNELYSRKIATEVVTADQQWWRTNPDPALQEAAVDKLRQLDAERRALLDRLLGPGWDRTRANVVVSQPPPPAPPSGVTLTGPILGALPEETKQLVQDINAQASLRVRAYMEQAAASAQPPNPAELARLRQQTRDELARILTPVQLEEYLLRFSQNGIQLREQFKGLDLKPDEFRSVFRAVDALDQQLQMLSSTNEPANARRRTELEQQREKALQQALGPERYGAYSITRDPTFAEAATAAQSAGATPEAALGLYQINKAVEQERRRINADATLTTSEKIERLQQMNADQEKSLLALFGEDAYQRFRRGTNAATTR